MAVNTQTKYVCDRCISDKATPNEKVTPHNWGYLTLRTNNDIKDEELDLCVNCVKDFLIWLETGKKNDRQ
jgi:hypothetical protein